MTIYFHNFVNQACAAASYVRNTARAHPTATKAAIIGVAILSSYAIAKYTNVEMPSSSTPTPLVNTFTPPQPKTPPAQKTEWETIKEDVSERLSATYERLYKRATSYEENKRMILEMIQEKVIKKIFLS